MAKAPHMMNPAEAVAFITDRDPVQAEAHVAAEWRAHSHGRQYSIWPRGWQPLGTRPNGTDPDDDF